MDTMKASEVKKAIFTLSDLLGIEPKDLVSSICLLDKERFAKFRLASDVWNKFDDADIVERGKMLGYTILVED